MWPGTTTAAREQLRVVLPLFLAAGPSWGLLILASGTLAVPALCTSELIWSVPTPESYLYFFAFVPIGDLAVSWALMVAAMMLPTLCDALGHIRMRSIQRLRPRVEILVIAGYVAVWMFAGVVLLGVALTLMLAQPNSPGPFFLAIALAFLWQVSSWKQNALNRCHRRPVVAAFGPAAYRDALMLGFAQGFWCLASCWALMLMGLLAPSHHFAVMVLVALFIWAERLEPPRPPFWQLRTPRRAGRLLVFWVSRTWAN